MLRRDLRKHRFFLILLVVAFTVAILFYYVCYVTKTSTNVFPLIMALFAAFGIGGMADILWSSEGS